MTDKIAFRDQELVRFMANGCEIGQLSHSAGRYDFMASVWDAQPKGFTLILIDTDFEALLETVSLCLNKIIPERGPTLFNAAEMSKLGLRMPSLPLAD